MKEWFSKNRVGIVALALVISVWLVLCTFVPSKFLDLFAYYALGYYFLGEVAIPWVEARLEKYFK